MNKKTSYLKVFKAIAILSAALLVSIPVTGAGRLVTAAYADGSGFSSDTSLSTFQVDGQDVIDGQTVNVAAGRTSVTVNAVTTDTFATRSISGNTNLVSGSNTVTVHVEADDGTTFDYKVYVVVATLSSDSTLASLKVNDSDFTIASDGTSEYSAPYGTTQVTVAAVASSNTAAITVTGNTGLVSGSNTVNVHVVAEDTSYQDYSFKVVVAAPNTSTSLATFKVNGSNVSDLDVIELPYGTARVSVDSRPSATSSTYEIIGGTDLLTGDNTLTVSVTSQSGAVYAHSVTLRVASPSTDKSIETLAVNGETLVGDSIGDYAVSLPAGTSLAEIRVTTTSSFASYQVYEFVTGNWTALSGDATLTAGLNGYRIKVTAQDQTFTHYVLNVTVRTLSSDTSLSSVSVDGASVDISETVNLPYGTTTIPVTAVATSDKATVVVTGNDFLQPGLNTVQIAVTAETGAVENYTLTIKVAKSSNSRLTSVSANGEDITGSLAITTPLNATTVDIVAVTEDPNATYEVTGATGLHIGLNTVSVRVTAANGDHFDVFIAVTVPTLSADNSLNCMSVGAACIADGGSVSKPFGTSSVNVDAQANDSKAVVQVSGNTVLVSGANLITVTITAENGDIATYTFTVNVALSSDNSLASILANGKTVTNNGTVNFSVGTTEVTVSAAATDIDATVEVSGNTDLSPGDNTISIKVTAANGAVANYSFTAHVIVLSSDPSLATFTVNGEDALAGATINVSSDVTDATVVVQTSNSNATFEITSGTALAIGSNTLTVVVTAEDGIATRTYNVVVVRESNNTNLGTIQIGTETVNAGDIFDAPAGTTSVVVSATAEDVNATVEVLGTSGLRPGNNTATVVVTAQNGAIARYTFTIRVALSDNTDLSSLKVNGSALDLANLVYTVNSSTSSVVVVAVASDPDATVSVSGNTGLAYGDNDVVVTVTAANGTSTKDYTVVVTRTALSNNTNIGTIVVNGETVAVGATYTAPAGTTSVDVVSTAEDADATTSVSGNTSLVAGDNEVVVTVTAANGDKMEYAINVFVASLSNDTTLKTFTLDGAEVQDGDTISLDGTKNYVAVIAVVNDLNASVIISGTSNLAFGLNSVTAVVTAEDGTTQTYTINVDFPDIHDTSLATFTVNGEDVQDGDTVSLDSGVTEVVVSVIPTYGITTFEIEGGSDLAPGDNALVVTVTAADGETIQTYTVNLSVAFSNDTSLATFQVNGADVLDGDYLDLEPYTTSVEVNVETTNPDATFTVAGDADLVSGSNTLTVVVTAADGTTQEYTVILNVALGNNVELSTFTVNDTDVQDGDVVELDPYSTEAVVVVETVDPDATFEVVGGTDLVVGENTLTVTVLAADGEATATYTVTLNVALGNNVELSTFQV
ncbi:MAG: cadherin-like beta sandwich domain-containing protein, partial [Actinomycetes bacterium]